MAASSASAPAPLASSASARARSRCKGAEHRLARQRPQRAAVAGRRLRHPLVDRGDDRRRRPGFHHRPQDLGARRVDLRERAEHARAVLEHVVAQLADGAGDVGEQRRAAAQRARHRAPAPATAHHQTAGRRRAPRSTDSADIRRRSRRMSASARSASQQALARVAGVARPSGHRRSCCRPPAPARGRCARAPSSRSPSASASRASAHSAAPMRAAAAAASVRRSALRSSASGSRA